MIGPVTEPSDEAALAEAINLARLEWHRGAHVTSLGQAQNLHIARALLASPWLAAHDEQVARDAVEKALSEVEADVRQTLERNRGPKMQSPLGLAMACAIIAQHRQIRQATP